MFSAPRCLFCDNVAVGLNRVLRYTLDKILVVDNSVLTQRRHFNTATGNIVCPNSIRGLDHLRDPRLNKGLAFTLEERQALGIHGLLAAKYRTQKEQIERCKVAFDRYKDNFNKFMFLAELQDTNERLFYSLLNTDIEKYLPIVYTPTVGLACQRLGLIYRRARGIYITIHDKGHVFNVLKNWPEHDVKAIVFSDGERILGLGDLGAYGMGIPVGKLSLYTALAGIQPHQCLPVLLDFGTDNPKLLEDPLYIGLRQKRVRGEAYNALIDEFMQACVKRFGKNTLLQFEDFALPNAEPLLSRYNEEYCVFNDDIQGTASVAVAGLLAAMRITKKKVTESIMLFLGAGSASNGIANLTVDAMVEEGMPLEKARSQIYMVDIDGLVTSKRPGGVPAHAKNFGNDLEPEKNFEECVKKLKPNILIGCSTVGGAFTPAILKQMAVNTDRPIIFALSNPTSRAECSAQEAYDNTEGRCVYASGSPFPPVKYNGKEYHTGQGNNSYIFPGVALGVITTASRRVPNYIFLTAAKKLASIVKEEDLALGRIYPPLSQVKEVSFAIALEVAKFAYDKDLATLYPQPKDLGVYIKEQIYSLDYPNYLPQVYPYPELPDIKVKTVQEAYKGLM